MCICPVPWLPGSLVSWFPGSRLPLNSVTVWCERQVPANHIFLARSTDPSLSLAFIGWWSGAVKVGQVGELKVSSLAGCMGGQVAAQGKEDEGGH